MFKDFIFVALGGALGSVMRFGITVIAVSLNLSSVTATFTANILGSFQEVNVKNEINRLKIPFLLRN